MPLPPITRNLTRTVIVKPGYTLTLRFTLAYDTKKFKPTGLELALIPLTKAPISGALGQSHDISHLDATSADSLLVCETHQMKTIPDPVSFRRSSLQPNQVTQLSS